MSDTSIRIQTYFVCAVMIGCFSLLYPRIFHPMLMHFFGLTQTTERPSDNDPPFPRHANHPPKPSFRGTESESSPTIKRGGIMTMILPFYAVGIVIYLVYTLTRLCKSKKRETRNKSDEFLRHYYRDFHYDPKLGKFRMSHNSSSEDDGVPGDDDDGVIGSHHHRAGTGKKKQHMDVNTGDLFDWRSVYGSEDQPNIYRSVTSLPRDLEALLTNLESQDLNTGELSSIRTRLEQTEHEMTHLLTAMDHAEHSVTTQSSSLEQQLGVRRCTDDLSDYDDDTSEAPVTASEGEQN